MDGKEVAARRCHPGEEPGRGSAIMLPGVRHWGLLLRLSRNCLKSVEDEEWRAATGHSKGRGGLSLSTPGSVKHSLPISNHCELLQMHLMR